MDELKFEWDENKNTINKAKHKVSFEEAQSVFYDPDHSIYEERFIILGVRNQICWLSVIAIVNPKR